jgi:hypothetical protein
MSVRTAKIQGIMSLLNLVFRNSHPVLCFKDKDAKYPETKNMVAIIKISMIMKLRMLSKGFVEVS